MRNKRVFKPFMVLAVAIPISVLIGCGGGQGSTSTNPPLPVTPTLKSLSITPIGPAVTIDGSLEMTATGSFDDGSVKDMTTAVTWASDSPAIASIEKGQLLGHAAGVATITANFGPIKASTAVDVTEMGLSDSILNGYYAFLLKTMGSKGEGFILGSFSADGNGNINGGMVDTNIDGTQNHGAIPRSNRAYNVWADGRGMISLNIAGIDYKFVFVASHDGSMGKMISFDHNFASGTFERQDLTTTVLSGNFGFAFSGVDAAGKQTAMVGVFTTNSNIGVRDINTSGSFSNQVILANLAATAATRGTAVMGNTNFAYYIVNPGRALFLQTGPTAPPLAGAAEVQSATTAALPGNYVFLLEHSAAPSTGTFRKAGMLQLDMAGNIVGGRETGDPSGVITGGTLALAAGGRGLLSYTINTGASLIDRSAVIYILDPSTFFMMSTDTPDSFPGIGLAQQVQPGNLATGAFSYNVAELGQNNLLEVGQLIVRGTAGASSATLSGITYVNNNGTLSSVALAGTMPETSGKVRVAPLLGSQTAAMIFYVRGPNGAALVGTSPDVDGRLELQ